jgi:DNA-binding NarL/FixJ family response regulator
VAPAAQTLGLGRGHKKFTGIAGAACIFGGHTLAPPVAGTNNNVHWKQIPMMLRVVIVSDVRLVQEGLSTVLAHRAEINIVSSVDTLLARAEITRLQPHVVLFDAMRPDSVEFVKGLVISAPKSKVVAFGVKENAEEFLALAAAGTAGYICDSADSGDVVRVLGRVMCDELPCSPRAAASLYRRVATLSREGDGISGMGHPRVDPVRLSRRELQIAELIDCGLTNKGIGRQLGIEAATVKNHIHNMCEKLKVHRRGEAAARVRAIARTGARAAAGAPDTNPAPEVL